MKHVPIISTAFSYVLDVNSREVCYISAPHMLSDPTYYAWIKSRQPHIIGIMGNELETTNIISPYDMVLAYNHSRPKYVILPYILGNYNQTLESLEYFEKFIDIVPVESRIVVPQGNDLIEWIDCFYEIESIIKFQGVGISRQISLFNNDSFRDKLLTFLRQEGFLQNHNVHLLGFNKNPVDELHDLSYDSKQNGYYQKLGYVITDAALAVSQKNIHIRELDARYSPKLNWNTVINVPKAWENIEHLDYLIEVL